MQQEDALQPAWPRQFPSAACLSSANKAARGPTRFTLMFEGTIMNNEAARDATAVF